MNRKWSCLTQFELKPGVRGILFLRRASIVAVHGKGVLPTELLSRVSFCEKRLFDVQQQATKKFIPASKSLHA